VSATLEDLWLEALSAVHPRALVGTGPRAGAAALFWGKAAIATCAAWSEAGPGAPPPALVIAPRGEPVPPRLRSFARVVFGEHPLPGPGSFAAAGELLEFFDSLRRLGIRSLDVHLSGGASSLAWLPLAGLGRDALLERLRELYGRPLSIAALNERRARLCLLKGGGAAAWLARLAPGTRARVHVLSDVAPFGPGVVGSGPFRDGRIPHRLLADNGTLLGAAAGAARERGWAVLARHALPPVDWSRWIELAERETRRALARRPGGGVILLGGEPRVALPSSRAGRGGRQTQIAAALAARLARELGAGRVELLAAASDGVDGASRSAGARLEGRVARRAGSPGAAARLREAARRFDSARALAALGALRPPGPTGTNVQDLLVVRVRRAASAASSRATSSRG
jgi:glycerate-2-kinase